VSTKRLPSAKKLAAEVLAHKNGAQSLASSVAFLLAKRGEMKAFRSIEHFVTADPAERIPSHGGCEHHLLLLRAQLARELWSRQLFIGVSVLDDLLFYAVAHDAATDPVLRVLELIRDEGLHHPGLVIFPIHSFGMLAAGFLHWFTSTRVDYTSHDFGIALTPQTNDMRKTLRFLDRARLAFGVAKPVNEELIEHWYRSRSAYWLTSNPLFLVKTQSFPGGYYENQFLLLSKLRTSAAMVSMLACLQPEQDPDAEGSERLLSSSTINNFQTLDFRHYIVLHNAPRKRLLDGDCVPMHLRAPALAEVSDLGIELDPRFWRRRHAMAARIHKAVSLVHAGYLKHSMGRSTNSTLARVYRKLYEALVFFRRSFHKTDDDWGAIISLAIAFEMSLTDSYAAGVHERIVRRTKLLLRGVPGTRRYVQSVRDLYSARGGVVHSGSTTTPVNIGIARRAFVAMFVALSEQLNQLKPSSTAPMRDLAGDTRV
jgi:hypothetical protein